MKRTALLSVALLLVWAVPTPTFQDSSQVTFRGGLDLVSVDVVVRDGKGEVVDGLTADDFEVTEDGRPQRIRAFSFQLITDKAPAMGQVELLGDVQARVDAASTAPPPTAAKTAAPAAAAPAPPPAGETAETTGPMTSQELAGRRLIVLLFDTSSMQPDDVQRSVDSAQKYVDDQMSTSDLVAVATVNTSLNVLTDFTGDRAKVQAALTTLSYTDGTATPPPDDSTMVTDETTTTDDTVTDETSELDMFNNDVRLRVLKALAESLAPIEQKKAIVYFSAGMQRSGSDNQVELRAAINAAVRGNVSIYSVDTRGLQAVVPGGDATRASGRGQSLFSGRGMAQQFARLSASQDTLVSLSSDTGGRAFTDSNDFGAAFDRVRRDMSAYYILGYSSTNRTRDGRFRRIQVRLKKGNYRVEARVGYYADRDFAHTAKADRESQLQDQLYSAVSSTDLPVIASAGWFRLAADKYYVPIALAVPGSAVTIPAGKDKAVLDILGEVRDERGFPVGRIRQTMELPSLGADTLAGKQILYQSGVTLPPGQFSFKVVVRENGDGLVGSFEAPVTIPELDKAPLKLSSVVLSTQLQAADKKKTDSPLVRDGVQLLPNLTHVVGHDQKVYFYYEVYEPTATATDLRTSLAFYRGKVKVLETPVVAKSTVDVPDRKAVLFQFEVPADKFEPGLYTCQVNVIDETGGNFAFPRLQMYVR